MFVLSCRQCSCVVCRRMSSSSSCRSVVVVGGCRAVVSSSVRVGKWSRVVSCAVVLSVSRRLSCVLVVSKLCNIYIFEFRTGWQLAELRAWFQAGASATPPIVTTSVLSAIFYNIILGQRANSPLQGRGELYFISVVPFLSADQVDSIFATFRFASLVVSVMMGSVIITHCHRDDRQCDNGQCAHHTTVIISV